MDHIHVQVTASLLQWTKTENNTCISAVVTCEAFLLYSDVGNVVVRSSPTICDTRKLSEAVSVTDPLRILREITLKCFAAASFQVFATTATV